MVAGDTGAQQAAHGRMVSALGGPDEPSPVPAVEIVDPGTMREREVEDRVIPLAGGDQKGRLLRLILGVDVGPGRDELLGPRDVIGPGCRAQGRVAVQFATGPTLGPATGTAGTRAPGEGEH